jgi:hypothetical protein
VLSTPLMEINDRFVRRAYPDVGGSWGRSDLSCCCWRSLELVENGALLLLLRYAHLVQIKPLEAREAIFRK